MDEKRGRGRPKKKRGVNPFQYESEFSKTLKIIVVKAPVEGALNKDGTQYYKEHERGEYVKFYRSSKWAKEKYKLGKNAKELLLHIPDWLTYRRHTVLIPREEYMAAVGISKTRYAAAIAELVQYNFLERTTTMDVFAVNPEVFFLGNRGRYFKDCVEHKVYEKKLDSEEW